MKLRSIPTPYKRCFVDRLAKGLGVRRRKGGKTSNDSTQAEMEPPSLEQVEQEVESIGYAIDEYIADQREQRSYA